MAAVTAGSTTGWETLFASVEIGGEVTCCRGCEGRGGWSVDGALVCCFCTISFIKACWIFSFILKWGTLFCSTDAVRCVANASM